MRGRGLRSYRAIVCGSLTAILLTVTACGGGSSGERTTPSPIPAATVEASTPASEPGGEIDRLEYLEARVALDPRDILSLNEIARERIQRSRETGDISDLGRAEEALRRSLEVSIQGNIDAVVLLASLSVIQHDFSLARDLAERAIGITPNEPAAQGVLADSLMGLGDYDGAAAAIEEMHRLRPDFAATGRQAFLAQTLGDGAGAEAAWRETIDMATGDGTPEHAAWAHAQLGNLFFMLGRLDDSQAQYEFSLAALPAYVHALAGLGRVAAARDDYAAAESHYRQAIERVPLPEYIIALGDLLTASGDDEGAQRQYDLVGAIEQLYLANGVSLDLQIVLLNADRGVELASTADRARIAHAEQPNIAAADVLSWAEYKAGNLPEARAAIDLALRTNTLDPRILFHAGIILRATGDDARGREYLTRVQQQAPHFSPLLATELREALASAN